jgi:hypothetical protein
MLGKHPGAEKRCKKGMAGLHENFHERHACPLLSLMPQPGATRQRTFILKIYLLQIKYLNVLKGNRKRKKVGGATFVSGYPWFVIISRLGKHCKNSRSMKNCIDLAICNTGDLPIRHMGIVLSLLIVYLPSMVRGTMDVEK